MSTEQSRFRDSDATARYFGWTRDHLNYLVRTAQVPVYRFGNRRYFDVYEIEERIAAQVTRPIMERNR